MLNPLPYQPITFEEPNPCSDGSGCVDENNCISLGVGSFSQRQIDGDVFNFQVEVGLCPGAEQLVENNNFQDGFTDWTQLGDTFITTEEGLVSPGGNDSIQQGGFINGVTYYIVVQITDFTSGAVDIALGFGEDSVYTITEAGEHIFWITAASSNLTIESIDGVFTLGSISVYEAVTAADIEVTILDLEGLVVADEGMNIAVFENYATISIPWSNLVLADYSGGTPLPYGTYTIMVSHCEDDIVSNPFNYAASSPVCDVVLSACMDGLNDSGLYFGNLSFNVRLDGILGFAEYTHSRIRYRNTQGRITNYNSRGVEELELRLGILPKYLLDFVGSLPAYNNFYIDGVEYSVESDTISPNYSNETPNAGSVTINVAKRTQVLNMSKCTAAEVSCFPPPNCWGWINFDSVGWVNGDCIGLVN